MSDPIETAAAGDQSNETKVWSQKMPMMNMLSFRKLKDFLEM